MNRPTQQHVPNFEAWTLKRLVAEARRLGVPEPEPHPQQAGRAHGDILMEAYS